MDITEIKDIYPFESNYIDVGGYKYHYVDEGEGNPILMVHGNPTWSFYYRNLIKDLSSEYRVIAPDHIGMGLSEKPQDYEYTLQTHINNLSQLVQKLKL
jgi:haloalkane dehalogenase